MTKKEIRTLSDEDLLVTFRVAPVQIKWFGNELLRRLKEGAKAIRKLQKQEDCRRD